MLSILTKEEREVIDEFVSGIKDRLGVITLDNVERQMDYNFQHGKGASYRLLNRVLPYVRDAYGLTIPQFERLSKKAELVAKYEIWRWVYMEELPESLNQETIVIDGTNYVILKGGIRIDYSDDYYQHHREQFAATGIYEDGLR